jgi:prepilin-type N-terminal cleavage/methylation domain-containing protein
MGRGQNRRAFTLVELMVVIVIIGILMAILLPVIGRIRVNVNEARVITEINGLSTGIATFKSKFGVEPPSRISIYLTQAGWTGDPASMATIRTIWPQFDFSMGAGAGSAYPTYWSTIAVSNTINLNSGECLLFFLGGVMQDGASGPNQVPTGFASNPRYPFAPTSVNANRIGPFFEFTAINRIRDIDNNGMNEYYDSLPGQTNPYLYFSSYEGQGYRLAELPQSGGNYLFLHDFYRVSPTVASPPATPPVSPTGSQTLPAQKPQSYQIISPGYDGDFGAGGVFNTNLPNSGLTDSNGNPDKAAFDNLTNINGSRLNP